MRISTLAAIVFAALAAMVSVAYVAIPNVETKTITKTRTVTKPRVTPARPTLAQFRQLMGPIETIRDQYTLDDEGRPAHCFLTDSSFSPDVLRGITWQAQWCWRVTQQEAVAGGLVG